MIRRTRSLQILLQHQQSTHDEACYVQQPLPIITTTTTNNNNTTTTTTTTTTTIIKPNQHHQIEEQPIIQLDQNRIDFLSCLPIELALYILLKLAIEEPTGHLLKCRLVSKTWQRLAQDNLIWKQSFYKQTNWKISHSSINHQDNSYPIARRLSQLIGLPNSISSNPQHHQPTKQQEHDQEREQEEPNWLKLFRDRYIIDTRWKQGTQLTKKLKGHKDSIYCLQMHDQQIITGSRDRTIKVWDTRNRECQRTLLAHKGSVLSLRFDDQVLLSGSSDSSVFVWDKNNWSIIFQLVGHHSGVLDLALNLNNFVSCSKDTTIKIWNRHDGSLLRTISGHTGPVNALELSLQPLSHLLNLQPSSSPQQPTSSRALLSASGDSSMKLWELDSGKLIRTYDGHLRGLACLKLVEENRQIITGSNDETIKIWDLITSQCLRTLLGHSALVRSLDFSLAHNRLVSGSYDKTIKVWDLTTGQLLLDFRKGTDRSLVFDVKFNLTTIVSVGHPNSIMLLDFADGLEADMFY